MRLETGTLPGIGSFRCEECGCVVTLAAEDELPPCPACEGTKYVRASLFDSPTFDTVAGHEEGSVEPDWVGEAREEIAEPGEYVAYEEDDRAVVVALRREWTRIGRSLAADVRFDDPTVSRRHALIVRRPDGVRVLDDRSLNGVFVNGERVEWRALRDGDEIIVGRHVLRFIELTEPAGSPGPDRGAQTVAG
jgi:hypothetical protein